MGALFSRQWKSADQVRKALNRERSDLQLLAQATTERGRRVWSAYRNPVSGWSWVQLDLISVSEGDFGYKSISEDEGPYYLDCPLHIIEAAGPLPAIPSSPYAEQWRARVREHHRGVK